MGILLVAPGCGGGDSTTISEQEFNSQLEIVCNQGLKDREEVTKSLGPKLQEGAQTTHKFQIEYIRELIGAYQQTTEEIADIGLPEKNGKKAEELVAAREEAAAKVEADPLHTVDITAGTFDKANKVAEELEAKSCAT